MVGHKENKKEDESFDTSPLDLYNKFVTVVSL
jgi:hypothetical protein